MKKILPVLLLVLLYTIGAKAQDDKSPSRRNTYIKVNPTTLINELDILIEQEISNTMSIELGVAGIYTDYPDYVLSKKIDIGQKKPDISTEQFVEGRGLGFRAGLRWYLIPGSAGNRARGAYFQPTLLYKKVFYPNEEVTINSTKYTESASKNVFGLQLLLGRQFSKDRIIFDPYIGAGARVKVYRYSNYNAIENGGIEHNDGRLVSILPSLQLGIKLGLRPR
ncbi:hypothetical protein KTO58_25125 [Chitinophaga pendula]|uniref:hypothetical protein n=1 Tax=Chitinophaga TaxID=79328 RepID=UPI000BAF20D4|nr:MULTISPECIES: hypothetical protein [Chitinophaga]ASZ10135.1 hypothetical protein CK934_03645 [Chitinophaga sp. MD30]UCJ06911.1 hypothetical protein KTO58_25125 [Chitinophaga pendula]